MSPCGQCYGYYVTVSDQGVTKTVRGVDGGTDAPADYWQVVSLIKGIAPPFEERTVAGVPSCAALRSDPVIRMQVPDTNRVKGGH